MWFALFFFLFLFFQGIDQSFFPPKFERRRRSGKGKVFHFRSFFFFLLLGKGNRSISRFLLYLNLRISDFLIRRWNGTPIFIARYILELMNANRFSFFPWHLLWAMFPLLQVLRPIHVPSPTGLPAARPAFPPTIPPAPPRTTPPHACTAAAPARPETKLTPPLPLFSRPQTPPEPEVWQSLGIPMGPVTPQDRTKT